MTAPAKKVLLNDQIQRFILLEISEENRNFVAPRLLKTEEFIPESCSMQIAFGRYFFADINEGHIPFLLNHYEGTRGGKIESQAFNADVLLIIQSDKVETIDAFQEELLAPISDELKILQSVDLQPTKESLAISDAELAEKSTLDEEEGFFNGGSYLFWQSLNFAEPQNQEQEDLADWKFLRKEISEKQAIHTLILSSSTSEIEDYLDEQFAVRSPEAAKNLVASQENFGAYFFLPSDETLNEI